MLNCVVAFFSSPNYLLGILMSHPGQHIPEIHAETLRVARAAFSNGNPWLQLRDHLGAVCQNEAFASLFADIEPPAVAPWRLVLVTLLQFDERLTDRQAADAVRSRLDWKYLLALPLDEPGFDASVLSAFRERLTARYCVNSDCRDPIRPARTGPSKSALTAINC
jgi:sirohydrochlorin ferrochelatase